MIIIHIDESSSMSEDEVYEYLINEFNNEGIKGTVVQKTRKEEKL